MTDKLHDAMRAQAETTGFAPIDLSAVVAGGQRRVRRRRAAGAAGAVAGIAATVALVVTLAIPDKVETAPDPALPFPTAPRSLEPVFGLGNQVFVVGQPGVTVAGPVTRLERTLDEGFAYETDDDEFDAKAGQVHFLRDGTPTDYGTGTDLVADADGHVAAWLRRDATGTDLVVLDTRTLEVTEKALEATSGRRDPIRLRDVDGPTAYLHDGRGEVALDLVTGKTEPVDGVVVDAEDDVVVVAAPDDSNEFGTSLYAETASGRVLLPAVQSGVLSPDGSRFFTAEDDPPPGVEGRANADVVDTATGEHTTLDVRAVVDAEAQAIEPLSWLDADTVSVLWISDDDTATQKLITCTVSTGACEVTVDDVGTVTGKPGEFGIYPGLPLYQRATID